MSKEKLRQLDEINRPMNEELFNNLEKQYEEIAKVRTESEQIEEMANEIMTVVMRNRNMLGVAETLYNIGYRRQEWISVDERLPEVDTNVLVITTSGSFKVARCNIYHNKMLVLWATNDGWGETAITHWMPLPEAPKN